MDGAKIGVEKPECLLHVASLPIAGSVDWKGKRRFICIRCTSRHMYKKPQSTICRGDTMTCLVSQEVHLHCHQQLVQFRTAFLVLCCLHHSFFSLLKNKLSRSATSLTLNHSPAHPHQHLTFLRGTRLPVSSKRPAALSLSTDASRACSTRPFVSCGFEMSQQHQSHGSGWNPWIERFRQSFPFPRSAHLFPSRAWFFVYVMHVQCGQVQFRHVEGGRFRSVDHVPVSCRFVFHEFVHTARTGRAFSSEQTTSCDAMPRRVTSRRSVRNARAKPLWMCASNSDAARWFGASTEIV